LSDIKNTQRLKTNLQLFAEKETSSTLNLPPYIDNAGKFVNWTKQKVKVPLTTEQVDELVALAKKFGVKVEASASDLAGHTGKAGTNWGIPHQKVINYHKEDFYEIQNTWRFNYNVK